MAGGAVFVTTGFGQLLSLSAETGEVLWVQDLEAFGGAAPAAAGDLVYIAARDGSAWAIEQDSGRIRWRIPGPDSPSHIAGGIGPAVTDKWAIFPFATGEILSVFRQGGVRNWTAALSDKRHGLAVAQMTDLRGGPVVDGGRVYVGSAFGSLAALNLETGERVWTTRQGVMDQIATARNSLFVVSDENRLLRLAKSDGRVLWSHALPHFTKDAPKRRKSIVAHYGPILAGGMLIVASSDDQLRVFDPETGTLTRTLPLAGGAASAPVVAGGTLYVVTTHGMLHAFQ